MKTVKTRDSATTILRKLGVNSRDYALFIGKNPSGLFEVDDVKARASVVKEVVVDLIATKDVVIKPAEVKPIVPPAKTPKLSISGMAEQLLLAGKTNTDVWLALKERFKLGDDKKHYPSWFRSRLRRQGRLAKREKKS